MQLNKYTVFLADWDCENYANININAASATEAAEVAEQLVLDRLNIESRALFVTEGWVDNLLGHGNGVFDESRTVDPKSLSSSKYLCQICADFCERRQSSQVDDIGEHMEWKAQVDAVLTIDSHYPVAPDDAGVCDVCNSPSGPRILFKKRNRAMTSNKREMRS